MSRWTATVFYRTENGPVDVSHSFEELEELHNLVERGPDWGTIIQIVVVYNRGDTVLTVEEAARL